MPTISVVITTYNRAHFLPRAIESALAAGSSLEVLVVDDASTDGTSELCGRMAAIRYLCLSSNRGLAQARNVGIAESSSEFITFLDDDDLRLPGSLDAQLRVLEADGDAAFCYGQALIGDARRQLPTGQIYPARCSKGDIFWDLLENNFIPMPSVLARKSSLLEQGGFNTELKLVEDWDMWLRLSERSLVAALEVPVAIYRKAIAGSDQMCSNSAELCRQALVVQQMALNRFRGQTATRAKRRRVRQKLLDHAYEILMTEATNAIHEGDAKSAGIKLRQAFRFRPFRTMVSGRFPWLLIVPR
jgi:cellulose synthase/poly-beta-1,6-N-acetylglucosamine synthase-like glycosyltransferase